MHHGIAPALQRLSVILVQLVLMASSAWSAEMVQTASVAFHDGVWGRYAEISIEYLPTVKDAMDAYNNPSNQAGLVEQTMAAQEANPPVRIIIPGLEYGMTGAYTNVRIETNEGISIRPGGRVGSPSNPNTSDYVGKVTIAEFTADRIRGSYSADLYNKSPSDRETRARARDFVGHVEAVFDIDTSGTDQAEVDMLTRQLLPDAPADLSGEDAALMEKIKAAGVPSDLQGFVLEQLRGMPPEMQDTVLSSYNDSY